MFIAGLDLRKNKGKVGGRERDSSEEAVSRVEAREEGVCERGEAAVSCAAQERGESAGVLRARHREASGV